MKEMVEFIAKSLVNDKDAVVVTELEGEDSIIITLSVAESDMGKVIGRQEKKKKSIRTIIKAATAKSEKPVFLEIR